VVRRRDIVLFAFQPFDDLFGGLLIRLSASRVEVGQYLVKPLTRICRASGKLSMRRLTVGGLPSPHVIHPIFLNSEIVHLVKFFHQPAGKLCALADGPLYKHTNHSTKYPATMTARKTCKRL
jgi:hypothetical protein